MNHYFKILCLAGLLSSVFSIKSQNISHKIWNDLLIKHVTEEGKVDYKGFIKDSVQFNKYFAIVESHHPDNGWNNDEKLAYWLNAYNAYTVRLIIRSYPVKSIKDLGGSLYKINTTWDIKFIHIGKNNYDLNNIEHGIIRKQFNEPRIHFALNCAALSCPRLYNRAFTSKKLNDQLNIQARYFINNTTKNKLGEEPVLSKIFSWYKGDFTKKEGLIQFINKYADVKINPKTKLSYGDYNWMLND